MSVEITKLHEDASLPLKVGRGVFEIYAGFSPVKDKLEASVLLRHLKPNETFSANWSLTQPNDWVILPGASAEINLGCSVTIPKNLELVIQGDEVLATRNVIVFPATKNGGFSGILTVVVSNRNSVPIIICPGDRIGTISTRKVVEVADVVLKEKTKATKKKCAKRKTVKCV